MASRKEYVMGSKKYMGLFSIRPPVVMVTNKMAAILEKFSTICVATPVISITTKWVIPSPSCPECIILHNYNSYFNIST